MTRGSVYTQHSPVLKRERGLIRGVMAVKLRPDAAPEKVQRFLEAWQETPAKVKGVLKVWAGRNIPGGGWDWILDSAYDGYTGILDSRKHPYAKELRRFYPGGADQVVERTAATFFKPWRQAIPEPRIRNCIKRTLVIRVIPTASPKLFREFEERLAQMPVYIKGIRNWVLSHDLENHELPRSKTGPDRWTHVWEQEFQTMDGFKNDYMTHPFHYGVVDPYFDPDGPICVAKGHLHTYYEMPSTILGWKP
ncbi:MAG: hypothetical protein FJ312_11120 [SAR202 cluster bacterium]|nr:hypothetical protein [SAR202 cluster bacterium]